MDLNKDNKNVYTVDAESYSEYMHENLKKPTNVLNAFIKILLAILLLVVGYFFYRILKDDLSFTEVFNKKELISTFALMSADDKIEDIKKEDYVEILAKTEVVSITSKEEKNEITKVIAKPMEEELQVKVEEKVDTTKVAQPIKKIVEEKKVELAEVEVQKEILPDIIETIKIVQPINERVEEKKVIPVEHIEVKVQKEIVSEALTIDVTTPKKEQSSKVLSETYLDRMVEELNSI